MVGFEDRPATAVEIQQMKQLVAQAMEDGAVNLSTRLLEADTSMKTT